MLKEFCTKHNVIHETGSTSRTALLSEQDQATATDNMHRKFCDIWRCTVFEICEQTDRQTDRQTGRLAHCSTLQFFVNKR